MLQTREKGRTAFQRKQILSWLRFHNEGGQEVVNRLGDKHGKFLTTFSELVLSSFAKNESSVLINTKIRNKQTFLAASSSWAVTQRSSPCRHKNKNKLRRATTQNIFRTQIFIELKYYVKMLISLLLLRRVNEKTCDKYDKIQSRDLLRRG